MKRFIKPLFFTICFIAFTILVKTVDVQPVGPQGSLTGFSALNTQIHQFLGTNAFCYTLTQILGVLAILTAAAFACTGLVQLIKRKSLLKVDQNLLFLGLIYILVIILYILFEKLAINYRPVVLEEGLEPSYPSTHTMLILTIMGTGVRAMKGYIKNKTLLIILQIFFLKISAVTVVCRLLSGVHWFTDIIGGVQVSLAFITLYQSLYKTQE